MQQFESARYKSEEGQIIIEVAIKNSRQLFNERDPAPFIERDLDDSFTDYVLSSVQEFPVRTKMKMRITLKDESDSSIDKNIIRKAISSYYIYEARLVRARLKKRMRIGRFFLVIGLVTLFGCLSLTQVFEPLGLNSRIAVIMREGLVIIGWVAMWRPIEMFLYDWWPMRELRIYLVKIATMDIEIISEK
jgi:hypothetical protein